MCEVFSLKDLFTFGFSISALVISYFSFMRDRASLSLNVSVGHIVPTSTFEPGCPAIWLSVTNIGRRNVILGGIGFEKYSMFRRLLAFLFPSKFKAPKNWWGPKDNSSPLRIILFDSTGAQRKLGEGDIISCVIPLTKPETVLAMQAIFKEARSMFIEDTAKRRFSLSGRQLRKLRVDLQNPKHEDVRAV
jgi:hypothetical protein